MNDGDTSDTDETSIIPRIERTAKRAQVVVALIVAALGLAGTLIGVGIYISSLAKQSDVGELSTRMDIQLSDVDRRLTVQEAVTARIESRLEHLGNQTREIAVRTHSRVLPPPPKPVAAKAVRQFLAAPPADMGAAP